ncbi:MAG TPA: two-component regulator propeller domain-containing protein [Blastocatellia bacterium]|nr:two-component regulator propeller domain-containing protein [Blastocatellia bacterium]
MARLPADVFIFVLVRLSAISLLILLWLLAATVQAQYRFDSWTTDNGLPQNSVRSIIQTRDGYLWMTTFDGLVRFDGVRFKVFNKSNTKGLSTNRFTVLYEDKDGALWAGTGDGGLTFYRDGVFTSYTTADGMPAGQVIGFGYDLKGELLIAIGDGQFYLREGRFIFAPPEYQAQDIKHYLAPSGAQWTIDSNGAKQVSDGRTTQYSMNLSFGAGVWPYEDSQGNLWLGAKSGIYRLRDSKITRYMDKDGVPSRTLLRPQCEDDEGGIWFATGPIHLPGIGLARFKDERFTVYSALSTLTISCVFKDREGTIWVGTSRGLHRMTKQVITGYSTASGILNPEVYPIFESRNGDIWVGSTRGLSRFRDGQFKNTMLPYAKNIVQALCEDGAGRLWIGIVGGLLCYENGKLKDLSNLVRATVCTILMDRYGNVWVGSERGLFKFNGERVVAHYTAKDGLPADNVTVIHEDRNGNLWIGTSGALAQFKDGQFITYTMAEGVATNHIWTIYEDDDGTFWIGTYDDGLSRFRDGRFFNYKVEHGLFDNGVFQILEDRRGYFWISCNRGIYRVSRQELNDFADGRVSRINSVAYGKQDGMLNIECNGGRLPAGIIARDGKFWFPTQEGVAVVDTEAVYINQQAPPVLIESVMLERDPVAFRGGVTIEPGQRGLEISYTGLSYIKSEQIKFKYKLEGLDADWVDAGTRRAVYFPYLPPGSYTFRVIAANSDGVWNDEGASMTVTVRAPFWQQLWFRLLSASVFIGIALFTIRSRLTRLKSKQAEREAFSRRLIESQESERKRIAAELHDSLGQNLLIVKNWTLVGLNTLEENNPAREHLNEISETTSLALDEVRQIAHNLRPYQLERLGLTNTIEQMVRQIKNSSDIEFITEIDNIDGLLSKESEINLYRVVQECVNNVLKHSAATNAWLFIKRTTSGAEITCRDDGRGFNKEASSRKGGMGLVGMAERVRMLGGRYAVESAPGKGTTIHVTIDKIESK